MTAPPFATDGRESGSGTGTMARNDTRGYERIAFASSERPDRNRWTELAVYYLAEGQPPFIAEVVGDSRFSDEERRVKKNGGASVDQAMRLFDSSGLRDDVVEQVGRWLRERGGAPAAGERSPAMEELIEAAQAALRELEGWEEDPELTAIITRLRKAIEEVSRD